MRLRKHWPVTSTRKSTGLAWSKAVAECAIVGNPRSGPGIPIWHGGIPEHQPGIGAGRRIPIWQSSGQVSSIWHGPGLWVVKLVLHVQICAVRSLGGKHLSNPVTPASSSPLLDDDDDDDNADIQRDFNGDVVKIQRCSSPPTSLSNERQPALTQNIRELHALTTRLFRLLVVVPILYATKVIPPLLKTLGMYFCSHVSARYVIRGSKGLAWIYIEFSFTAGALRTLFDEVTSCPPPCPRWCRLDRVCTFDPTPDPVVVVLVPYILAWRGQQMKNRRQQAITGSSVWYGPGQPTTYLATVMPGHAS
ncbi:hypothetical protein BKA70DRAFT_1406539 [Coprinopsis sp. MPI-PUGE-AT-0042]|nr:hypothetical protein BKA70DRAFT_1406539 [Coprinopsis sp. MPI-PUGE-AT-0042]